MTRRRILIVAPGFPAQSDEPGLASVADLVERLAAHNDVRVIALRHPQGHSDFTFAGARVTSLGFGRAGGAIGRFRVVGAGVRAVVRAQRDSPIDLIHALWADEPGAVAVTAGRLIRRPAIVSLMGGELVAFPDIGYGAALGRGGRITTRVALRGAAAITAGSSYARDLALARIAATRLTLAPLGVDTELFKPGPEDHERRPPSILFVGSLEPVKDPFLMLRSFADVAAQGSEARLVVAGDGRLRDELESETERRGISDRVSFRGQVPRDQMPALYRSASVLCVTSRHEAQSMAAVEAAACGLPIVGTRVGVLPDLGAAALIVPGTESELSKALLRVLDEPTRARMSAAAREVAERDYEIGLTSARLERLYEEVLRRPR
ncbi:MAG: glycosyltransferase [Candidatus Limnocylindrales bacterium]